MFISKSDNYKNVIFFPNSYIIRELINLEKQEEKIYFSENTNRSNIFNYSSGYSIHIYVKNIYENYTSYLPEHSEFINLINFNVSKFLKKINLKQKDNILK